jgi:hypothetical protein
MISSDKPAAQLHAQPPTRELRPLNGPAGPRTLHEPTLADPFRRRMEGTGARKEDDHVFEAPPAEQC